MKLSISHIADHGTIAATIEAIAAEHDSIASGIIGPSFACSGPGSGWQQNYGVSDYAKRALSGDYGASSYIDSSDGTEATLQPILEIEGCEALDAGDTIVLIMELPDEDSEGGWIMERQKKGGDESPERIDGYDTRAEALRALEDMREIEWSEESVVEIALPSVEECLDHPEAWSHIREHGASYGMDEAEIDTLADKVAEPYEISDGNATEYAATLADAEGIIEGWYDYLTEDQGCPGGFGKATDEDEKDAEWEIPTPALDPSSVDALNDSIGRWEQAIAHARGGKDFAGHGNYYVTAADRMGLNLCISIRE